MRAPLIVGAILVCLAGCDPASPSVPLVQDGPEMPDFLVSSVSLREMPLDERDYVPRLYASSRVRPLSAALVYPTDADSVITVEQAGGTYYNPVAISQFGRMWANGYRATRGISGREEDARTYLRLATNHGERLWMERHEATWGDATLPYFPYKFGFALHGIAEERMEPVWYSGMAQGEALSLFSWLYELTEDEKWIERADATLHTMYRLDVAGNLVEGKPSEPRTSYVDNAGHIWFDEYPHAERTQVLNGFVAALFGVHDYYQATITARGEGDANAARLIAGAAATLRANGERYRAPNGEASYYCLKHRVQSESYHDLHVDMWDGVYLTTGDYAFKALAEMFGQDGNDA